MDTRSTAPPRTSLNTRTTAPLRSPRRSDRRAAGLVPADGGGPVTDTETAGAGDGAATSAQLRFFAEAAIDFGELAAVLDAVVGQGQGFLFFAGLEV